jgi:flagellar hook assembly protein FlgD
VLTPNNDRVGEATTISYSLSTRATVRVEVLDSSAHVVRSLANGQVYRSGAPSFLWNGRTSSGKLVRDGRYRVRLTASSPGQEASKSRTIVVDRTLGHRLARQADVRVRIMDGERAVAVLHPAGTLAAGAAEFSWDGEEKGGAQTADGLYRAFVEATTALGTRTLRLPLIVDTRAPVVRVLSARLKDGRSHVRLWLSEAATLRVRYGSPLGGASRFVDRPAGYSRLSLPRATRVRLQGTDAAANVGARVIARVTR